MTARHVLLALCTTALLAVPARAQQMPDPRQMSGIPRPDSQVKVGQVTVRVVHGELSKLAPEGTMVHLVAVHADGKVDVTSHPIDKNGRATFDALATDGSVAYYAYTLLGEDRLESEMISPNAMDGTRLMLVGRKLDKDGAPIGPVVDDAQNPDQPTAVPAGEVWVLLGGRIGAGVEVEVVPAGGDGAQRWTGKTTPQGENQFVARITGVPDTTGQVFVARVKQGSRWFTSKPFMMKPGVGAGRAVLVIDQVIVTAHIALEVDDENLRGQAQFMLQNFSGGPLDLGDDGMVLPMPVGAIGVNVADEMGGKVKVGAGKAIVWHGVLPPGQNEIIVGFGVPIEDGRVDFVMDAPYGMFQSTLIVEQAAGSRLTPPAGFPFDVRTAENGRKFYVVPEVQIPAGGQVLFSVDGLPQHPYIDKFSRLAVGLLVVLILGLALTVAVWNPWKPKQVATGAAAGAAGGGGKPATRRKELTNRRERLYDDLVSLERRRVKGDVDASSYVSERQALMTKLTMVLRELDQLDGGVARG